MGLYKEWAQGDPKNMVTVAHVTMHGSTRMLTDHLIANLIGRGVGVERFDLTGVDTGRLAMSLVDSATLLIGTPTVLAGPHPAAAFAATLVNALRPKLRFVGVYGSYGWGTRTAEQLAAQLTNLRPQVLDSVLVKGMPREEDYQALDRLAETVASKHAEAGLAAR
jgi:flavorubredoxin